jgi:hypothetical protein
MEPGQLTALRFLPFLAEATAMLGTSWLLKRWMQPPPTFGGRYWRSLLASIAALPVALVAIFAIGIAASLAYQSAGGQYENFSGGHIATFMAGTLGRAFIIWPFVIAWLVIKPRQLSPAAAMPPPLPRAFPAKAAPNTSDPAASRSKASFFRNWKNIFGLPEVEGIDTLSDQRINEIYSEVRDAFRAIAEKKKESLPDSTINGLVRDLLMDEVNGNYAAQFSQGTAMYSEHPIQMIFWKGRAY